MVNGEARAKTILLRERPASNLVEAAGIVSSLVDTPVEFAHSDDFGWVFRVPASSARFRVPKR